MLTEGEKTPNHSIFLLLVNFVWAVSTSELSVSFLCEPVSMQGGSGRLEVEQSKGSCICVTSHEDGRLK